MRHFKLFNSNFAFVQPATNLRFIGTLEPEFDRFLDHFFGVLRRFTLTDDAEFGTTRHIPSIFARLNHSGKLWKFHHDQVIPRSQSKNRGKQETVLITRVHSPTTRPYVWDVSRVTAGSDRQFDGGNLCLMR